MYIMKQPQQLESPTKPIQDRLKQSSHITVESAVRNNVNLNVFWYERHGEQQNLKYVICTGSTIEF